MLAAVDDVHHRCGQQVGSDATEITIERLVGILSRRFGDGHRDAENGVGSQFFLVGRAVQDRSSLCRLSA